MRILGTYSCSGGGGVSGGVPGEDPDDLLAEESEEIVLAVLDNGPVGEIGVEDGVVILVDVVEADVALPLSLAALCLGSACRVLDVVLTRPSL